MPAGSGAPRIAPLSCSARRCCISRIGRIAHSQPAIPLRESQSTLHSGFPRNTLPKQVRTVSKDELLWQKTRLKQHRACVELVVVWDRIPGQIGHLLAKIPVFVATEIFRRPTPFSFSLHFHEALGLLALSAALRKTAHLTVSEAPADSRDHSRTSSRLVSEC